MVDIFFMYFQVSLRQSQYALRSSLFCNDCRKHRRDDQQHERCEGRFQCKGFTFVINIVAQMIMEAAT